MNFTTWNFASLRLKRKDIVDALKETKIDLITLTEVTGIEHIDDYIHIYSGVPKHKRASNGVLVLIHKKFKSNIIKW